MPANHNDIKDTYFDNELLNTIGIEVMEVDSLRNKLSKEILLKPERIYFYMIMFITAGEGVHTVDFVQQAVNSGSLIVVKPGQIQQWQLNGTFSATLVLIDPSALPYWGELFSIRHQSDIKLLDWQTASLMPQDLLTDIDVDLEKLNKDLIAFDASDIDISLIRHQLFVMLLRITRWQRTLRHDSGIKAMQLATYNLFIRQLEANFRQQHRLQFYSARLGYSLSTISRACHAAEGHSAKLVIDKRIALEARRMLAHSSQSVAEIAYELGFSEATNFIKFFKRVVGQTPIKFRITIHSNDDC